MQATVILRVPPKDLLDALPQVGDDAETRRARNDETVRVRTLEDCVQLDIGRSLAEEPLLLFARITELVGEMIARHDAERGIPAYPSSYSLSATSWDAVVEELGEAAEWLPLELSATPAGMPSFGDLTAMLGPQGAAIAEQLQGPEGAELMQSAMAMAQQLMAGGGLEQLLGGQLDMNALAGQAGQGGGLEQLLGGQLDMNALAGQAGQGGGLEQLLGGGQLDLDALKGQAEAMLGDNPDLERQLREQLGAMLTDEGSGEGPSNGEEADADEAADDEAE